jgi:hypothetical protein
MNGWNINVSANFPQNLANLPQNRTNLDKNSANVNQNLVNTKKRANLNENLACKKLWQLIQSLHNLFIFGINQYDGNKTLGIEINQIAYKN